MSDIYKNRVIVTGGAGFIGSALVWALNSRGIADILVVDRLDTSEKWKNLVPLRFTDYVDADEFDRRIHERSTTFGKTSAAFHLGACSSTTESDAAFLMANNYEYTKRLAAWAAECGVRFIYASSAATYGALENDLDDRGDVTGLRPLNMYAYSKQLFDLHAQRTGLLSKITGVKYFNIFGPNEQHKADMRSLVDKAFHQIRNHGSVKLFRSHRPDFRDGEQRRDFLYVKDAVAMTLHLAEREAYGLFNVGSGTAHTWLDLVDPIFGALNVPRRIDFIDMPVALQGKYQYCTRAILERVRSTGYDAPITPLTEAVKDYVENYLLPDRRLDPMREVEYA